MNIQFEALIAPSRKYIMTPSNTHNYDEVRRIIENILTYEIAVPEDILDKTYEYLRTTFMSKNVFCLGMDKETDDICLFEFDISANSAYIIFGYDENGTPYLEMLN